MSEVAQKQAELIGNICRNFPEESDTNFLSSRAQTTIEGLLTFAYNTSNGTSQNDINQNAIEGFASLFSVISRIPNDQRQLLKEYLSKFFDLLNKTLDSSDAIYPRREDFQGYLCLALETVFRKLLPKEVSFETASRIIEVIIQCF